MQFKAHLRDLLIWYGVTFSIVCWVAFFLVGFASIALGMFDLVQFAVMWIESAAATFLVTCLPTAVAWFAVAGATDFFGWTRRGQVFLAGIVSVVVVIWVISFSEDASFTPRWIESALAPALFVGMLPLLVVGPRVAFRLGGTEPKGAQVI